MPTPDRADYRRRDILKIGSAAMAAGVAGCSQGDGGTGATATPTATEGGQQTPTATGQASPTAREAVDAWVFVMGPLEGLHNSWAESYQEQYNVDGLNWTVVPFGQYQSNFASTVSTGDPPPIAAITGRWVNMFANQDLLVDLSEHGLSFDPFLDSLRMNMSWRDGGMYSAAGTTIARVLTINEDMFEEAGLEIPDYTYVPSYDDMAMWLEELTTDDHVALTHNAGRAFVNWAMANGAEFVNDFSNPTDTGMDSEGAHEALEFLVDAHDAGQLATISEPAFPQAIAELQNQNTAMITSLSQNVPTEDFNWRHIPLPVGSHGENPVGFNGGEYFCVPKNSGRVQAGLDWAELLTQPEESAKVLTMVNAPPTVEAAYDLPEIQDRIENNPHKYRAAEEVLQYSVPFPNHTENASFFNTIYQNVQLAYSGTKSPSQAIEDYTSEMRSILSQ